MLFIDLAQTRNSAKQMQLALIPPGSGPQRLAQSFMGEFGREGIPSIWREKREDKLDVSLVGLKTFKCLYTKKANARSRKDFQGKNV